MSGCDPLGVCGEGGMGHSDKESVRRGERIVGGWDADTPNSGGAVLRAGEEKDAVGEEVGGVCGEIERTRF